MPYDFESHSLCDFVFPIDGRLDGGRCVDAGVGADLKYDFRSFTNEISKWQIDIDDRLSETEDQIQGILRQKILMM